MPGKGRPPVRTAIAAGAAVVVAGAALTIGLQAATPHQVQAPVPATSGTHSPGTAVVPGSSQPRNDEGDEGDEGDDGAGTSRTQVAVAGAATASAPAPAPVASSGGSGG